MPPVKLIPFRCRFCAGELGADLIALSRARMMKCTHCKRTLTAQDVARAMRPVSV